MKRLGVWSWPRGASVLVVVGVLVAACSAPAPPPKPAEAPKPAAEPAKPGAPASPPPGAVTSSAAVGPSPSASPAAKPPAPVDKADEAAARAEGSVVWYTSTPLRQAQVVAEAFERKYGFKIELFRTGGEQVIQRYQTELAAGKIAVDLMTASDPAAFNAMIKKDQLVQFRPANWDKVPASGKDPQGYWTAQRLNLVLPAYRTDKVEAADVPKKWADFGDRKYKGKLVHADAAFTAIAMQLVGTHARTFGWEYYQKLRDNDILIVQGHQRVAQILESGERVIAAEAGDADMWDSARKGIKVEVIFPEEGVFVIPGPSGVVKGSPHPNAAKLLAEFMLSDDTQALFPQEGFYAGRTDIRPPGGRPPLDTLKILPVDLDYIELETGAIKKRFGEIFS